MESLMLVGFAPIVGQRLILVTLISLRIVTSVRSGTTQLGRLLVLASACTLGALTTLLALVALATLAALIALLARAPLTQALRATAAIILTRT
jgi:hypothetical protein